MRLYVHTCSSIPPSKEFHKTMQCQNEHDTGSQTCWPSLFNDTSSATAKLHDNAHDNHKMPQGHRRCMMEAPCSSYSCFDTHSCWNDPKDARIEPPIQTEKRRSCATGVEWHTRRTSDVSACVSRGGGMQKGVCGIGSAGFSVESLR